MSLRRSYCSNISWCDKTCSMSGFYFLGQLRFEIFSKFSLCDPWRFLETVSSRRNRPIVSKLKKVPKQPNAKRARLRAFTQTKILKRKSWIISHKNFYAK